MDNGYPIIIQSLQKTRCQRLRFALDGIVSDFNPNRNIQWWNIIIIPSIRWKEIQMVRPWTFWEIAKKALNPTSSIPTENMYTPIIVLTAVESPSYKTIWFDYVILILQKKLLELWTNLSLRWFDSIHVYANLKCQSHSIML